MDLVAASESVAALVASGAGKEIGDGVGRSLVTAVVAGVHKVFGSDRRSVDALEQASNTGSSAAADEFAAALRWYAQRDPAFAADLVDWAERATPAVSQEVHAGRDSFVAGRDQTVINYRRVGE